MTMQDCHRHEATPHGDNWRLSLNSSEFVDFISASLNRHWPRSCTLRSSMTRAMWQVGGPRSLLLGGLVILAACSFDVGDLQGGETTPMVSMGGRDGGTTGGTAG